MPTYFGFPNQTELNFADIPKGRPAGTASGGVFPGLLILNVLSMPRNSLFYIGGLPNCMWWIDRKTGIAATVFKQIIPHGDLVALEFLVQFEQALYKHLREA